MNYRINEGDEYRNSLATQGQTIHRLYDDLQGTYLYLSEDDRQEAIPTYLHKVPVYDLKHNQENLSKALEAAGLALEGLELIDDRGIRWIYQSGWVEIPPEVKQHFLPGFEA